MIKSQVLYEKKLGCGREVAVAGRPVHNNDLVDFIESDNIFVNGQDAAIVLPGHGLVGVFDGATGSSDIGSPALAAATACEAVERYFDEGGDDLAEAMREANRAVKKNLAAGLCVGGLLRLRDGSVDIVNVGDTALMRYDSMDPDRDYQDPYIGPPQHEERGGRVTNYLGRYYAKNLPDPVDDFVSSQSVKASDSFYALSDGAWSIDRGFGEIEPYHLRAAQDDWPLLELAKQYRPRLSSEITCLLLSEKGREIYERVRHEEAGIDGEVLMHNINPALIDPVKFNWDKLDWRIWEELVRPYIEDLKLKSHKIGSAAVARALVEKPIGWQFERPVNDDSTVVVVAPVGGF